jgi:hypothetical protein
MIYIFVAFKAEAKPLIEAFGLKASHSSPFLIYSSSDIHLVISGVGATAIAQALTYTYMLERDSIDKNSFFINIGTAGSSYLDIGDMIICSKVEQEGFKKAFYPDNLLSSHIKKTPLTTSLHPQTSSDTKANYDMEAYGFCEACERLLFTHQFGVLKIISDNLSDSSFKKEHIEAIFAKNIDSIKRYFSDIKDGYDFEILSLKEKKELENLLDCLKLSFTQSMMLKNYAKYYKIRHGDFVDFLDYYAKINPTNKHNRNKIFNDVRQFLLR